METNQPHITKLVQLCKKSDRNAQLQLYKAYYKAMFNSAFRILKDSFEAEDVMQEAFLAAFTKLNTYKEEVTFGAWLKKIVINKALSQLKKNNTYRDVKMAIVNTEKLSDEEENIDFTKLEARSVLGILNNLKNNYRLVLTLNLIEGYDYDEIAQIMNYTNENVRTTISRAKKKLRQEILNKHKKRSINE